MKNNIIFLDCTQNYGYQYSAANTKVELMARGIWEQGDNCFIHNGLIGTYQVKETTKIEKEFATIITYSQKGHQLLSWIFNIKTLYKDLRGRYNQNFKNILILEYADFHIFLIYVLFGRLLHYKIVIIAHEWAPIVPSIHWLRKPSAWLYAATFGYMVDAILPISEYIIQRISVFHKPYMKLPILADFTENQNCPLIKEFDYFLYCVYAAHSKPIFMILNAYKQYIILNGKQRLILVLAGNSKEIAVIKDYFVNLNLNDQIVIKQNLPYNELFSLYRGASALLIPLNPNEAQDEARFSQKIAEYVSSKQPIITNNVGEIKFYFKDRDNIILASSYSEIGFYDSFVWIENNMNQASIVGKNGYELGREQFNYVIYGKLLHDFFIKLSLLTDKNFD
jgi:hypothetical protein